MKYRRRKKRSRLKKTALRYWFDAVARRKGISALLLAESSGTIIAANREQAEIKELATIAPLLAVVDDDHCSYADRNDIPVFFSQLVDNEQVYLLCAVGEKDPCQMALIEAMPGVRRILAEDMRALA
jgi:hypothetical protein